MQTSFLYFAKINDCEKCLKILSLKEFTKQRPQLINYKGSNDWCPLHYASLNGNVKLVDLLLVNETEIDAETSSKLTSLMIACQKFIYIYLYCLIKNFAEDMKKLQSV